MQAWLRALSGSRASSSALKLAWVHQQGGCLRPVARSISIAHWLAWPHSGHTSGGSGVMAFMVNASVATAQTR